MANKSRNKKNQPPTGEGKKQSTHLGDPQKLSKGSTVTQAQRGHPELNMGTNREEAAGSTRRRRRTRNARKPAADGVYGSEIKSLSGSPSGVVRTIFSYTKPSLPSSRPELSLSGVVIARTRPNPSVLRP